MQWTAPAAGTYSVNGLFQAIDTGGGPHQVEILQDNTGTPLFSQPIAGFGSQDPFSFNATVNTGETVDFLVAYSGDFSNLSTGLEATISSVPEPTSIVAVVGLVAIMGRRRAKVAKR